LSNLAQWLASLGLEKYLGAFEAAEIDFDIVDTLTDADLEALGLPMGPRRKLLRAAASRIDASGEASPAAGNPVAASSQRPRPDGERRQMTVLFADMVGSTALSQRLDPEDLRQVIRSFQDAVAGAVARFDGHVAKFLGDGVLVYFGWPRAHEDAAARAVRAALDMTAAVRRLRPLGDVTLQVRVGIATGLVVVGELGAGSAAAEQAVIGETPNLAARLQDVAGPGGVVVSEATRRLLGTAFVLEPLGSMALKGLSKPVPVWRVAGTGDVGSRFEAERTGELTQLVGRDDEIALLMKRWELASSGGGQVVLLTGEAGIGKSRICGALRERLAAATTLLLQCSPYHTSSALYPVSRQFEILAGIVPADAAAARADKLARSFAEIGIELTPTALALLNELVGANEEMLSSAGSPQARRATLQALLDIVLQLAARQPVLFLVEDAHWMDPTTAELVELAVERLAGARVLIVLATRPEKAPVLPGLAHITEIALNRLSAQHSRAIVESLPGAEALAPSVIAAILARTDGVPLFAEELTRTVVEVGLHEPTSIPSTLHDSLMARLDRLTAGREVAQVGAAIGRGFSQRLLGGALGGAEADVAAGLAELVQAEVVSRQGEGADAQYTFRHALIRDAAYGSMLKSQRTQWHARIADAIERVEPATLTTEPERLALHHREAGNLRAALTYGVAAADSALARIAFREALVHCETALELIARLEPDREITRICYDLHMRCAQCVSNLSGVAAPALRHHYALAGEAAAKLGEADKIAMVRLQIEPLAAAGDFGGVLRHLSWPTEEAMRLPAGLRAAQQFGIAYAQGQLGRYDIAAPMCEEAARLFEQSDGTPGMTVGGIAFEVLLGGYAHDILAPAGYLERASRFRMDSIALCLEENGRFSNRVLGEVQQLQEHVLRGDVMQVLKSSELLATMERSEWSGLLWLAYCVTGVGDLLRGQSERAFARMNQGLTMLRQAHGQYNNIRYLTGFVSATLTVGRIKEAHGFLAEAEQAQRDSDCRSHAAELLRFRGKLAELDKDAAGSEQHYRAALELAENQGAKLFELRAATDLAGPLRLSGRAEDARVILERLYGWFTEGLDYPDLKRARDTIAVLAQASREATARSIG
jgi:class 3 adenylate cyclase